MWRMLGVLAAMSVVAALVASHGPARAQGQGQEKQLICHVSDDNGAHIIEVAEPAVPKHLENHGDCLINSADRELIGDECDPTDANDNDICDIQP